MTDIAEDHELVLADILEEPLNAVAAIEDILETLVDEGLAYLAADGYRATEKGRIAVLGPFGYSH